MPTYTPDHVQAIGRAMASGRLNDEQMEKARSVLKQYRRESFAETKIDATPDEEFVRTREGLGPSSTLTGTPGPLARLFGAKEGVTSDGFASEEARQEYEKGAEGQYRRMAEMGIDVQTGIPDSIRAKAGLLNFRPEVAGAVME